MKTIITIFAFSAILFSCSSNKSETKKVTHDSATVFALYHIGDKAFTELIRQDVVGHYRFDFVDQDSSTAKKKFVVDTFYQIVRLDTLRRQVSYILPKDSILLLTPALDPLIKKHNLHFPKPDTTK